MPEKRRELEKFLFPEKPLIQSANPEKPRYMTDTSLAEKTGFCCRQLMLRDVFIRHQKLPAGTSLTYDLEIGRDLIQMFFVLKGGCRFNCGGNSLASFRELEHNILFFKKDTVEINAADCLECVEIYLSPGFIETYFPFKQRFEEKTGRSCRMSDRNLPTNHQLLNVLSDLIQCDMDEHLKKLYIKAKIIELLILQLVQLEELEKTKSAGLKQSDIDKMKIVHDLIAAHPEKAYSLAYLARAAGTNEQYLKAHFKMIFGKTVFSYLTALRMERAKELLLSGESKISEIATRVGYRYPTHFTQAFKKYFGCLPLKIRTTGNAVISAWLSMVLEFGYECRFMPELFV